MKIRFFVALLSAVAASILLGAPSHAADIKILTAGAFKSVVVALQPEFEKTTGHKLIVENDTAGALLKRIQGGQIFDVVFTAPAGVDELIKDGKVVQGSRHGMARVGVGVMVKEGAPKPDISTVEAFRKAVLDAKSVAYIDPASGGSSGVYLAELFARWGIADQIKPKVKLKQGGYVADLILSGDAELGIHQISEILGHPGVALVGPLPAEIQNYTVYASGIAKDSRQPEAASAFVKFLSGPQGAAVLKSKGMEPPATP
jgi:molybdate transport system substrate-binding protein